MAEVERQEETELVDVSEVSEMLPVEEEEKGKIPEAEDELYLEARSTVATLRERFAAFLIDSSLLFYLYFMIGTIARRAFYGSWDGPLPTYGWQGLAFNGFFLFAAFMYYFIFESVFFATTGKFCAWMYVRQKNGEYPAMASVFVRNVFRLIDYIFPFIPFFCMELTRKHQRLGDFIGGTTVIKKHSVRDIQYPITMANIASASGRVISAVIDIGMVGAATFGYLLLLSPEYSGISKWILLFTPVIPIAFFVITETLTSTTPGKWLFGYTICQEDGSGVSFSGALIRTFVGFFELNVLGLLVMWLSTKHQRIGDLAADTVVTSQKRRWPGAVALAIWILLSSLIFMFGWKNDKNLLKSGFKFNFLPTFEFMGSYADESQYKELTITHIRFAANDVDTIRTPPVFQPSENVFIISDVYGYERSGRMVWLQEDIDVRYPDGSIGLHQENIIDYHQVLETRGAVELTNSLKLPSDAKDGTYTVTITVRDLFAHEYKALKATFEVRSPIAATPPPQSDIQAAPAAPAAPTVPPPAPPVSPSLNAPPPGTQTPPSQPTPPQGAPNL